MGGHQYNESGMTTEFYRALMSQKNMP